jgi:hypothetical protein
MPLDLLRVYVMSICERVHVRVIEQMSTPGCDGINGMIIEPGEDAFEIAEFMVSNLVLQYLECDDPHYQ